MTRSPYTGWPQIEIPGLRPTLAVADVTTDTLPRQPRITVVDNADDIYAPGIWATRGTEAAA